MDVVAIIESTGVVYETSSTCIPHVSRTVGGVIMGGLGRELGVSPGLSCHFQIAGRVQSVKFVDFFSFPFFLLFPTPANQLTLTRFWFKYSGLKKIKFMLTSSYKK